jgi:hypothetical protein
MFLVLANYSEQDSNRHLTGEENTTFWLEWNCMLRGCTILELSEDILGSMHARRRIKFRTFTYV